MNVLTFDNEASEQENNEELDEKRKCRNAFLEHLLDHMIDVNSFVRAKVCTTLNYLN